MAPEASNRLAGRCSLTSYLNQLRRFLVLAGPHYKAIYTYIYIYVYIIYDRQRDGQIEIDGWMDR